MKMTFVRFATVAAMAAGMALAQVPAAPARQAMRGRMMQTLNLSDAQKQQARTFLQQAKQNAQPLMTQLRANRQALAAAVKANDAAQIQSLAAQQGSLQGQLLGIRSEARAKVYALLTPEQKAKADEMREKVRERMKQRFEKRKANNG
jgi:protein CpxP